MYRGNSWPPEATWQKLNGGENSHGARPVHQIIALIKWIRTSRLSIKISVSLQGQQLASRSDVAEAQWLNLAHKKPPPPLGPYRWAMPRALWWSWGGGRFLMSEVPL